MSGIGWSIFWLIIVAIAMAIITPYLGISNGNAALLGMIVGGFTIVFVLGISNR